VYRGDADHLSLKDWPQTDRDAFKAVLRIVVRAMLVSPTARVSHLTISPDWTDDGWMAVDTSTGVITYIARGGDC
jgi:hypothetical protein